MGPVEGVSEQAEPAERDLGKELFECPDRVETEAEDSRLAQRDGRVGIGDAEQDRDVVDARSCVEDLQDDALRTRLVDEL